MSRTLLAILAVCLGNRRADPVVVSYPPALWIDLNLAVLCADCDHADHMAATADWVG